MVVVDFCALGGRCARGDWHTGKRKGEGEGGEAKILGFGPWSLVLLQDPAARRATAAATRSVSRERFGLGTAIRQDEVPDFGLDELPGTR